MSAGAAPERWKVAVEGARLYEQHRVPSEFEPVARHLLAALPPGDGRVLDVACGTGVVARLAAGAGRARVTGIDLNPAMIDVAREAAPAIDWRLGDATALPFEDGAFDVAYCQQGLQHFADPAKVLAEIRRVLRRGGRLGVAVWQPGADDAMSSALGEALDRHADAEAGRLARRALGDEARLRGLLEGAGFGDLRVSVAVIERRFEDPEAEIELHLRSSGKLGAIAAALPEARRRAVVESAARRLRGGAAAGAATVRRGTFVAVAAAL